MDSCMRKILEWCQTRVNNQCWVEWYPERGWGWRCKQWQKKKNREEVALSPASRFSLVAISLKCQGRKNIKSLNSVILPMKKPPLFLHFLYLFERQREMMAPSLIYSPKCLQQLGAEPGRNQKPGTEFRSPMWIKGTHVLIWYLPLCALAGSGNWKGSRDIPSGNLTPALAFPASEVNLASQKALHLKRDIVFIPSELLIKIVCGLHV